MRKLLTALLILPFALWVNGGTAVPAPVAAEAPSGLTAHALTAPSRAESQPPLPGQLSSAGPAVGVSLPDGSDTGRWRTRGNGQNADPLDLNPAAQRAAVAIALLRQGQPQFRQALARTRSGQPSPYSRPPPPLTT